MVSLQLGQGPALGQRAVDQGQSGQGLHPNNTNCHQAQQTMPRCEVRFAIQVFIVTDSHQAQSSTGDAEALQDPVKAHFGLVWKLLDGGAMGREEEYGLSHEGGELVGKGGKSYKLFGVDLI